MAEKCIIGRYLILNSLMYVMLPGQPSHITCTIFGGDFLNLFFRSYFFNLIQILSTLKLSKLINELFSLVIMVHFALKVLSNECYGCKSKGVSYSPHFPYDVIKRVTHLKFLGVIYDEKLTFAKHIAMLTNKLSRSSSLIYQLRDYLPINILKNIYYAHIYPHLNYCNPIW